MTPRRRTRVAGLIACGLFASLAANCPFLENLPFFGADAAGTRVILLRIVNESGVDVLLDATFFDGSNEIRNTTRRLAVQGPRATDLVVPTATTRIHVTARQDQPLLPNAQPGDFLADEDVLIDLATLSGATVTFVIHPAGWADCNQNGIDDRGELTTGAAQDCNLNNVPDTCDLAAGDSADCNGNAVPDECDIAAQSSSDCNANSIPDECDLASGLSKDCNLNLILDQCDPIVPVVLVIAEPHQISQSDQDGITPSVLLRLPDYGLGTLEKIDLDRGGSRLFFTAAVSVNDGAVHSMPLGGGTPTQIIGTQEDIGGIGLHPGGKMYWAANNNSAGTTLIRSSNLDGSGTIMDVVTGPMGEIEEAAVDPLNGRLYFTFSPWVGTPSIQRANLDGSAQQTVIPFAVSPSDVEVWPDGDTLFWTEEGAGRGLYRAALDGSAPTLIAGGSGFTGLAFDADNCKLYWTVTGGGGMKAGLVECVDIDGANRRTVLTGLDNPEDIALYR